MAYENLPLGPTYEYDGVPEDVVRRIDEQVIENLKRSVAIAQDTTQEGDRE